MNRPKPTVVLIGDPTKAVQFLSRIGRNCGRAVAIVGHPDVGRSLETVIPAQYIFTSFDDEPLNRILSMQRSLAFRSAKFGKQTASSLLLVVQAPTAKNGFLTRSLVDQLWFLKPARQAGAIVCLLADADAVIEPALAAAVSNDLIDGWIGEPTTMMRRSTTTVDQPSLSGVGTAIGCLSFSDDDGDWKPAFVRFCRRAAAFDGWIGIRRQTAKTGIDGRFYVAQLPRSVIPLGDLTYRSLIVPPPPPPPPPVEIEPAKTCFRKLLLRGCCSRPKVSPPPTVFE